MESPFSAVPPRVYSVSLPGSHRLSSYNEDAVLKSEYDKRIAEMAWMLPALNGAGKRDYGLSSKKLIRHCLTGEPLDSTWERPFDHWDLMGATKTAGMAPAHLRAKARAVIEQYREWLAAEGTEGEEYVRRADAELAEELSGA